MNNGRSKLLLFAALQLWLAAGACAAELAAVVSSDYAPYSEACSAFAGALNGPPDIYDASSPSFSVPYDLRYVATFGARAAALRYPPETRVVYALAPVVLRGQMWYEISLLPSPDKALSAFKALQPGLKRLAVFWNVYPGEYYLEELRGAGRKLGIGIISARLSSPDSFPKRLRHLMGRMDAFWLMPDPALITNTSLMVLGAFSCDNSIPFYAPTRALLERGATAAYAPDLAGAGIVAAMVVSALREGGSPSHVTYPKAELTVNSSLRGKCRWPLSGTSPSRH